MKIQQLTKSYQFGQNRKFLWKFITVMKIHYCDENSSLRWELIIVLNSSLQLWKFIIVIKLNYCDESLSLGSNSSLWRASIILSKFQLVMKGNHYDEHSSIGENVSFIFMKIQCYAEN